MNPIESAKVEAYIKKREEHARMRQRKLVAAVDRQFRVQAVWDAFIPAARMLAHLHGGRADGTYERRLLTYTGPDLLALDDFGLKPLVPPGPEDFYDVINERYERGAMIVTSNLLCGAPHKRFNAEPMVMRSLV